MAGPESVGLAGPIRYDSPLPAGTPTTHPLMGQDESTLLRTKLHRPPVADDVSTSRGA